MAARISRCQGATRSQRLLWWDFVDFMKEFGIQETIPGRRYPNYVPQA